MDEFLEDYFIEICAGDKLLDELGNTGLSPDENISEFIDNSIQSAKNHKHHSVFIEIEIGFSPLDGNKNYCKIKDDSCGMDKDVLQKALRPGETSQIEGGLHEHGIGLNHAISGIGSLSYIKTKRKGEDMAIVCENYRTGRVPISMQKWDEVSSGTEILLKNIKGSFIKYRKEDYRQTINRIKSRYRYFLCDKDIVFKDDYRPQITQIKDKFANITFKVINLDKNEVVIMENLESSFPRYAHPLTKENKPFIEKKVFTGKKGNWTATLILGFAPSKKTNKKNQIKDTYGVSQGVDIIVADRIVKNLTSSTIKEIGIDCQKGGNSWMRVRGEVHLHEGFKTTSAKNSILHDENMQELKEYIKEYVQEINFYKLAPKKAKDEEKICDRLYSIFSSFPGVANVEKGYDISHPGYPVDLTVIYEDGKKYVWEVKCEEAGQKEVLQPFGYMINNKSFEKTAYLVAKEFSDAAHKTKAALEEMGFTINFIPRSVYFPEEEKNNNDDE
jgi:hypothetical protein